MEDEGVFFAPWRGHGVDFAARLSHNCQWRPNEAGGLRAHLSILQQCRWSALANGDESSPQCHIRATHCSSPVPTWGVGGGGVWTKGRAMEGLTGRSIERKEAAVEGGKTLYPNLTSLRENSPETEETVLRSVKKWIRKRTRSFTLVPSVSGANWTHSVLVYVPNQHTSSAAQCIFVCEIIAHACFARFTKAWATRKWLHADCPQPFKIRWQFVSAMARIIEQALKTWKRVFNPSNEMFIYKKLPHRICCAAAIICAYHCYCVAHPDFLVSDSWRML